MKPIALRMVMEIATLIRRDPGAEALVMGIGGIESGTDAAQFILLGADTTQVCTGVMKFGYDCVKRMCDELLAFMRRNTNSKPCLISKAFRASTTSRPTPNWPFLGCRANAKRRTKLRPTQLQLLKNTSAPTASGAATTSLSNPTRYPENNAKLQTPSAKLRGSYQSKRAAKAMSSDEAANGSKHPFDLEERTAVFGENVIRFCHKIPRSPTNNRLIDQLVGSGTSVGANYCEASERVSKKDFRNTVGRCAKEAKETKFFSPHDRDSWKQALKLRKLAQSCIARRTNYI